MKIHALKLKKGEDLLLSIERFAQSHKLTAGIVLSGVGNIDEARLLHGIDLNLEPLKEPLEIVALTGTVTTARIHLHISFAKKSGSLIGGHLAHGCIVEKSAEIIIADFEQSEIAEAENSDGTKSETQGLGILSSEETDSEKKSDYDTLVTRLFQDSRKLL